jgi:hypothetical protein
MLFSGRAHLQKSEHPGIRIVHFNKKLTVNPFGFVEGLNWWVPGKSDKQHRYLWTCLKNDETPIFCFIHHLLIHVLICGIQGGFFFLLKMSCTTILPMAFSKQNTGVGGPKNGSSKSACRASRLYTEQVFTGVNIKSAWRAARLQSSCTGVHSRTRQRRSPMVLTMNYVNHRSDGD